MSPLTYLANNSASLVTDIFGYLGSCVQGSCSSFPTDAFQIFQSAASNISSWMNNGSGAVFSQLFDFMPDGGNLPSQWHEAASYFGNTLYSIDFILPVSALVQCFTVILSVKIGLWALHLIRVLIGFVRGIPVDDYRW